MDAICNAILPEQGSDENDADTGAPTSSSRPVVRMITAMKAIGPGKTRLFAVPSDLSARAPAAQGESETSYFDVEADMAVLLAYIAACRAHTNLIAVNMLPEMIAELPASIDNLREADASITDVIRNLENTYFQTLSRAIRPEGPTG